MAIDKTDGLVYDNGDVLGGQLLVVEAVGVGEGHAFNGFFKGHGFLYSGVQSYDLENFL